MQPRDRPLERHGLPIGGVGPGSDLSTQVNPWAHANAPPGPWPGTDPNRYEWGGSYAAILATLYGWRSRIPFLAAYLEAEYDPLSAGGWRSFVPYAIGAWDPAVDPPRFFSAWSDAALSGHPPCSYKLTQDKQVVFRGVAKVNLNASAQLTAGLGPIVQINYEAAPASLATLGTVVSGSQPVALISNTNVVRATYTVYISEAVGGSTPTLFLDRHENAVGDSDFAAGDGVAYLPLTGLTFPIDEPTD